MSHEPRASRRNERGTALFITLIALVVLTFVGLSLALVTETEMLIGSNEQVIGETFFAADSGVAMAVAQRLVTNTGTKKCIALLAQEGDGERRLGIRKLGYSVDSSDLYPAAFGPAAYTKANEGREDKLYNAFFLGKIRARRGSWPIDQDVPEFEPDDASTDDNSISGDPDQDNYFTLQAEKQLDIAFFMVPIQPLQGLDLVETFTQSGDSFGCDEDELDTTGRLQENALN